MTRKPRARELGLPFPGTPGPARPARQMQTGVTAIVPRSEKGNPPPVWAGW